jgi:preprotein translocase SecE subunit
LISKGENKIMARTVTRPVDDEEEDLIEEGEWKEGAEEEAASAGPVLSDSRRRKMLKRGETLPEAAPASATTEGKGRPTPSQRDEVDVREGNVVTNTFDRFVLYLKETWSELNKVTWPTNEEVRRLTYIVLIVTAITAALLGIVSFIFSSLTQRVADPTTATVFGILTIGMIVIVAFVWLFRERLPGAGRYE